MGEPSSVEAVFCEALEKEPAERAAFLDRACAGYEPLRREVQSLFDAHQKVGHFLERPRVEAEGVADLAAPEAADSSPVRALVRLKTLHWVGDNLKTGKLADLAPLRGMKLKRLRLDRNPVADLSPLPRSWPRTRRCARR